MDLLSYSEPDKSAQWKKEEEEAKVYTDARLACEHSSMTSSTTELLDFMHTRPGEIENIKSVKKKHT